MPAPPPLHHMPVDSTPTPPPPSPSAAMMADAFDLGRPIEPLVHHRSGAQETWTLGTMAGRFLVKRLWTGPDPAWRQDLERAMVFERRARQADIDMARPIEPREPAFGYAARVHGFGVFRVYEWMDHHAVGPGDDVAEWLGSTLGRLHQLEPLSAVPDPQWYGIFPPVRWHAWLADGEAQGRLWAPALREGLVNILEVTRWVGEVFAAAGGYVVTHRDVEPWNVLITDSGPRLVDWDTSGPDSAPLEAAHCVLAFAGTHRSEPDADIVKRALAAYRDAGGGELEAGRDMIARRVGLRLNRISERLSVTLGLSEFGSMEPMHAEVRAREQIEDLPHLVSTLTRWAALLGG